MGAAMTQDGKPGTERHLFIGGPGRAGTSFLVRYLTELGLDTELARNGAAGWDEDANAGLETLPPLRAGSNAPYVVKTPHLHQCIDAVLAGGEIGIDAVIVPLRDLAAAAASRVVVELQHVHREAPWMAEFDRTWEAWGLTRGGVVYSLNPLDQGRLLAVGFYHLVERLVQAGIPVLLLGFPRIVEDADYLFECLRPVLPASVERAAACAAHARVAEPDAVRVGRAHSAAPVLRHDAAPGLDALALRRELASLRGALAAAGAEAAAARATADRIVAERDRMASALAQLAAEREQAAASAAAERAALRAERDLLDMELRTIRRSRAWRLTAPYRFAGRALRRLLAAPARF
jgi:hypothetical protein